MTPSTLIIITSMLTVPSLPASDEPTGAQEAEMQITWPDGLQLRVGADIGYQSRWRDSQSSAVVAPHRAFIYEEGVSLSFMALDVAYEGQYFGGHLDLRFGNSASRLIIGAKAEEQGIQFVKQAYVSYKPTTKLRIDFGQWDTIYGAEVADSTANLNYTRGGLYFLMQPFYHTGLRVSYDAAPTVTLTAIASTDTNDPLSFETAPDMGGQVAWHPSQDLSLSFGYYLTIDGESNRDQQHFFDIVGNARVGPVSLVLNINAGAIDEIPDTSESDYGLYGGASLAAGMKFGNEFGAALRVEVLADPSGLFYEGNTRVGTLTGTLEYAPEYMEALVFRVDQRLERSSQPLYANRGRPDSETWVATIFGLVLATDFGQQ